MDNRKIEPKTKEIVEKIFENEKRYTVDTIDSACIRLEDNDTRIAMNYPHEMFLTKVKEGDIVRWREDKEKGICGFEVLKIETEKRKSYIDDIFKRLREK